MNTISFSTKSKHDDYTNRFVKQIQERSDRIIEIFLVGYFIFGLAVASTYDTWLIGVSVGGLLLVTYFVSKKLFPGTTVNQYVASACVGVFMAQFIYQLHGMFKCTFLHL
jgi:two-component system, sensor histidine kinase and response regulator